MIRRILPLALSLAALSACNRDDGSARKASKSDRTPARSVAIRSADAAAVESGGTRKRPVEQINGELTEVLHQVPDDELGAVFESVRAGADPGRKSALYAVMYEETLLRPGFVRLPLLLELARQPELEPSLRVTIMAELGTTLATDHGTSWADWSLAIDEHLAATDGLLRVE